MVRVAISPPTLGPWNKNEAPSSLSVLASFCRWDKIWGQESNMQEGRYLSVAALISFFASAGDTQFITAESGSS